MHTSKNDAFNVRNRSFYFTARSPIIARVVIVVRGRQQKARDVLSLPKQKKKRSTNHDPLYQNLLLTRQGNIDKIIATPIIRDRLSNFRLLSNRTPEPRQPACPLALALT